MKISCVIPAKGHSRRLPNKNMLRINGETLVHRACRKALQCNSIDAVYLDTESDEIIQNCSDLSNLKIIRRPRQLATNFIGANELMVWALHSIENCDILLQTFATSPLLTAETIDDRVEFFERYGGSHDSFLTVHPEQEYVWDSSNTPNYDLDNIPNSFELPFWHKETHGLYGIYADILLRLKRRVGDNPMLLPINKIEAFDINDEFDFEIAKRMLQDE